MTTRAPLLSGTFEFTKLSTKLAVILCGLLTLLILAADYFSGPLVQFPILFLVPISLSAWFIGKRSGFALAVILPLIRLYFTFIWRVDWGVVELAANAVIRIVVLSLFVFLVNWVAEHSRRMKSELRLLRGLLPICSYCKKIRDENSAWQPLEEYISDRSEADFSHSICPECARKYYGEIIGEIKH